jgi:hypothetical protein
MSQVTQKIVTAIGDGVHPAIQTRLINLVTAVAAKVRVDAAERTLRDERKNKRKERQTKKNKDQDKLLAEDDIEEGTASSSSSDDKETQLTLHCFHDQRGHAKFALAPPTYWNALLARQDDDAAAEPAKKRRRTEHKH